MTIKSSPASAARAAFVSALQAGEQAKAANFARILLAENPGLSQISFISRELDKAIPGSLSLKKLKVGLLSSFSIEFIKRPLSVLAFLNGIELEIYISSFGQYQQEIRDANSGLYAFSPDVVILSVEGSDWLPEIYNAYIDGLTVGFDESLAKFREQLHSLIRVFRTHSASTLLVNNFSAPVWPQLGILDGRVGVGQAQLILRANESLASLCRENRGVFAVDYAGLVARTGALAWYDERMNHYAKSPITMEMLPILAGEYVKYFRGLTGLSKKCLVLDLDNTLWGGVLGEDGPSGIQLGAVYPGSAYLAFQREIANLHKRGILLAIASKNNPADVEEMFANHPSMLLKKECFAALQVHWGQKSESLREIARQLNIGLEHLVLADDSPAECEEVLRNLPMVRTIQLPKQPEHFVRALHSEGLFDGLSLSLEDRRRGELYRQHEAAEQLRESTGSLEEFYRSLEMGITFAPVDDAILARSAQLTQKTNQFNATTIRFAESEIAGRAMDPHWILIAVSVRDKFGDNGIVGLMMARLESDSLRIETFLLSCRVIGRTVETAMLAYLCQEALSRGARKLEGRIIPTSKNAPVRDLFSRHSFQKISETESGETLWNLDLANGTVAWPEWIRMTVDYPAASRR